MSSVDSILVDMVLMMTHLDLQKRFPINHVCEREGVVQGDEGAVGGVAQVVSHGVKVVGVHGEEGREKDGEVREEVKGEVEQLREKRSSWMVWRWSDGLKRRLEPMWV